MQTISPPVIAVSIWSEVHGHRAPRFSVARSYLEAIEAAGGAPFGVAPLGEGALRALYDAADGLLLTGGGDINPARYGEAPIPELGFVDEERDAAELELARWALEDNKPVLAICRGHQVLNVACGGSLYQDLPAQYPDSLNHYESRDRGIRGLATHELDVAPGTRLAAAIGEGAHPVNTHHHQAVKVLGEGLEITGRAEDGVVEAIELKSHSWAVGVQCHPEEMWHEHEWAAQLFRAFVGEVRHAAEARVERPIGALREAAR